MENRDEIKAQYRKFLHDLLPENEIQTLFHELKKLDRKQIDEIVALRPDESIWSIENEKDEKHRLEAIYRKLEVHIKSDQDIPIVQIRRMRRWLQMAGIAAILMLFGFGLFYFRDYYAGENRYTDIAPGRYHALLHLPSGEPIDLDSLQTGVTYIRDGIKLVKQGNDDFSLAIEKEKPFHSLNYVPPMVKISAPKGAQFSFVLPDGSKVWLNAASSLAYPVIFENHERRVELEGEAFFEVAKRELANARIPFFVYARGQEVEVLGTQFSIKAYADEEAVTTALAEGSVKISAGGGQVSRVLSPGEQSVFSLTTTELSVAKIGNMEEILAWKKGDFYFNSEELTSIMQKIARWYNVDVVYEGSPEGLYFGGYISRKKHISAVLEMMETTGKVKFKVQGRRIHVII